MAVTNKRYIYRVYDYTGNFITEWQDVITDPAFSWQINNGPGELIIKLARPFANFGEGYDVAFENKIELYVQDKEAQKPILIYSGRLNEIRPHFGKDGEWVEIQILGYASTLNDQIARNRNAIDWYNPPSTPMTSLPYIFSTKDYNATYYAIGTAFQPTIPNISGFQVTISGLGIIPQNVVAALVNGDQFSAIGKWSNIVYTATPGNILASGVLNYKSIPTSGLANTFNINFPKTYNLDTNKKYYCFIQGSGIAIMNGINNYFNGFSDGYYSYGSSNKFTTSGNVYDQLSGGAGVAGPFANMSAVSLYDTTAPLYDTIDPTLIAQDLINNNYIGLLNFDLKNSILTNQPVLYQFNRQTYKESLDKLIELSPPYWFYRVNPNNTLQFLPRNDAFLDHVLALGQHISEAQPIHSVNELQTRVTLYGGSDTGQSELIYVDDRNYMQARYTLKEKIVRDSRVHKQSTAAQFTRDYMDFYGNPSVSMSITVMDSNGDNQYGYDIESFIVGQRVLVVDPRTDGAKNFIGTADNINLDGDLLDGFDNYILAAPLQIMQIDYTSDSAVLTLANEPITAPHKIDDISGNLVQSQTGNSPVI